MAPVILRTGFENVKYSIHFTKNALAKGEKLAFCQIKHIEEYVDDSINTVADLLFCRRSAYSQGRI